MNDLNTGTIDTNENEMPSIGDFISIGWRRKFYIIIPFILISFVVLSVALSLPAIYKSTGVILVESQQVSADLVGAESGGAALEQLQRLRQRIMTSEQLLEIIKKYNLYPGVIDNAPSTSIFEDMRSKIEIEPISARTGRRTSSLISFSVSFENTSPEISQKVANELVTLFLNENIKERTEVAAETTEFIQSEANKILKRLEKIEADIASYRQTHEGSLPEQLALNQQTRNNLQSQLSSIDGALIDLAENQRILNIELEASRRGEISSNDPSGQSAPQLELRNLQAEYIRLTARYGQNHPDVKALKRQIDAFTKEYGHLVNRNEIENQLNAANTQLEDLLESYSPDHPDVKRQQREIEGIKSILSQQDSQPVTDIPNVVSSETLRLQARLTSLETRIQNNQRNKVTIQQRIQELDDLIQRTPQVQRGLDVLERDYSNLQARYSDLKASQLQADISESIEANQKGQRFTLLEPPLLPERPIKPERKKILFIGLFFALACGVGLAALMEILDSGIRGSNNLAKITHMIPLATIPTITTSKDENEQRKLIVIIIISGILIFLVFLTILHFLYKPLNLLWFVLLSALGIS